MRWPVSVDIRIVQELPPLSKWLLILRNTLECGAYSEHTRTDKDIVEVLADSKDLHEEQFPAMILCRFLFTLTKADTRPKHPHVFFHYWICLANS